MQAVKIMGEGFQGQDQFNIPSCILSTGNAVLPQVEATKFTEVGFHGRDVDQIIRDLVDNAIVLTRAKMRRQALADISQGVEDKIVAALCGPACAPNTMVRNCMLVLQSGQKSGRRCRHPAESFRTRSPPPSSASPGRSTHLWGREITEADSQTE